MPNVLTVAHVSSQSRSLGRSLLLCSPDPRQWQATISVPAPVGYACVHGSVPDSPLSYSRATSRHPTEPQCSYDPIEGLTLAPDTDPVEKIKQLEDQISMLHATCKPFYSNIWLAANLKQRLYDQGGNGRSTSPGRDGANIP
jgi:hypothetical protein